jgi:5-methylcytosine-specific restriction endonuclease McrBC GTP-binding regulatory subunit McrB
MNKYKEYWKGIISSLHKKFKDYQEVIIDVSELEKIGDRESTGYSGELKTFIGAVESYKDIAVFRDLKLAIEEQKYFERKFPGIVIFSINNRNQLKVTKSLFTFPILIEKYRNIQNTASVIEEIYKWKLIKKFKDSFEQYKNGNISFSNFFNNIDFNNLIYHTTKAVYKHVINDAAERFEKILIEILFNEELDLKTRITSYIKEFENLYFSLENHGKGTFQDERTISTLLTFRFPEKYTFFKDKFYSKLCKGMGLVPERPLNKIYHYYNLIAELVKELPNHQSVINICKQRLTEDCYQDPNNLILAQDILYKTVNSKDDIDETIDNEDSLKNKSNEKMKNYSLNNILFGPPGTGKTYNSINLSLEILGEDISKMSRTEIKKLFDEYVKNGQVVFTTFHQSMSYEDFIEGIKPITSENNDGTISYEVEPGIFKKICEKAKSNSSQDFDKAYDDFLNDILKLENEPFELKTPTGRPFYVTINSKNNLSLFTGKDKKQQGVFTKEKLIRELGGEKVFLGWEGYYKGIINYFKDTYNFDSNVYLEKRNYIIIIDEINRGNVSQIFGELITLIEDDKREGNSEALKITLPYSKETFSVPSNLYIIGTMNTADRSIEALDTALRRRFVFKPMFPDLVVLEEILLKKYIEKYIEHLDVERDDEIWVAFEQPFIQLLADESKYWDIPDLEIEKIIIENDYQTLISLKKFLKTKNIELLPVKLLDAINSRLEILLSIDHQIGHSFFAGVQNIDDLKGVFNFKIIPLLQEYFYGDFGKIGLVLGEGFFDKIQDKNFKNIFAKFGEYESSNLAERAIYNLKDCTKMSDDDFLQAVKNLLIIEK